MTHRPDTLSFDDAAFVDDLYTTWRANPASVPADWAVYFRESEQASPLPDRTGPASALETDAARTLRLSRLVEAFRQFGHRAAQLDPLSGEPPPRPELDVHHYGFTDADLDRTFTIDGLFGLRQAPLRDIVAKLRETYCRYIGVEMGHIDVAEMQHWLADRMEATQNHLPLTKDEQVRMLERLTDAEVFEQFLQTKFLTEKRFSLEGGESLIPMMDRIIDESSRTGVEDIVIGMAHRGRLNVLVNVLGKPAQEIFRGFMKFEEDGRLMLGSGDVKYHLGYSADYVTNAQKKVHLSLAFNPSHLEAIYPVLEGRVRARQDRMGDEGRRRSLALVLHGDSSFAGQGVVAEVMNYSQIPGYKTGGTIHIIVNNQVGFTTDPSESRSSMYASGLAKMLDIPILHVNGEDPESVAQVVKLAVEFRDRFQKDVVIDLYCFRKYGHNEGDEPRFTQPMLYQKIDKHPSIRQSYVGKLVADGTVSLEDAQKVVDERKARLETQFEETKKSGPHVPHVLGDLWTKYLGGRDADAPDVATGVARSVLEPVAKKLVEWPEGFEPHPKLVRGVLKDRRAMAEGAKSFDWGFAENLAFASLLAENHRVRVSGQDAARGTFTTRHAVWFDHRDGKPYSPLQHIAEKQGIFEVRNSPLSEFGVLGFDYGYSLDAPDALVAWEAQYGDFANGAQVIIDQFLSSAEDKWKRLSGLVMLLPHGFEGAGPEHSSARFERFLNLSAEDNWQVVNVTTPAQYFHALRRQVVRQWRKPLVVMTPKSLLRHAEAVSTYDDFAGTFQRVLGDNAADPAKVRRVLLCTGKVYYDLAKRRAERKIEDTAIIRVEQLYPYPQAEITAELKKYTRLEKLVWVQEEPWNMGAWFFLRAHEHTGKKANPLALICVSRPESASPATGHPKAHEFEQSKLLDEAFGEDEKAARENVRPLASA